MKTKPQIPWILDFMESFDLINKVTFPTNHQHNTIDLILTPRNNIVCNVSEGTLSSDHHLAMSKITTSCTIPKELTISFRKIKNIDKTQFGYDIITSLAPFNLNDMSLEKSVSKYNPILSLMLDTHAPLKTKTVKIKNTIPYFNNEIRQEIQKVQETWMSMEKVPSILLSKKSGGKHAGQCRMILLSYQPTRP